MLSRTFATVTFCPVGLDPGDLFGILESVFVVFERGICAGTVGVEDMIGGI